MRKLTHKDFINKVNTVHGDKYTVLGEYVTAHDKILVKCNICGHEWEVKPNSLFQGHSCPECAKKKISNAHHKTHEQFLFDVKEKFGDNITILGEYEKSSVKVLCKCNLCGREWNIAPNSLLQHGHKCRRKK